MLANSKNEYNETFDVIFKHFVIESLIQVRSSKDSFEIGYEQQWLCRTLSPFLAAVSIWRARYFSARLQNETQKCLIQLLRRIWSLSCLGQNIPVWQLFRSPPSSTQIDFWESTTARGKYFFLSCLSAVYTLIWLCLN